LDRAYFWERTRASEVFLTQPGEGDPRDWSWSSAMAEARSMAAYLKTKHWEPGSRIVLLSRNCAWWIMADLAIWMSGHVSVPIFSSSNAASALTLMEHCGAVACFLGAVDNPALLDAIPDGCECVRFPNAPLRAGLDWDAIVAAHPPLRESPARSAGDLATIIYTSGTTGDPKGAMHAFRAFAYFDKAVTQFTGEGGGQRLFSYLPLAHIAERALTECAAIYQGWHIFFCGGQATFLQDLHAARPTFFFSVPRLYAKFQLGVWEKVSQPALEKLLHVPVAGDSTRKKILEELGLASVERAASGSAALPIDILLWYRDLGLALAEGYGSTEAGITHIPPLAELRPGYVGRNAPGVETKIDAHGEVLIKSPMNMLGYYHDPDLTEATITPDGFIRTGDLGELDAEGWLKIKGRIKERFKTSKGQYVSPLSIELLLSCHTAIESCIVLGEGRPAPCAVLVLTPAAAAAADDSSSRRALEESLEQLVNSVNAKLETYQRLRFLALVTSRWTIDKGFLTPTLKLKRFAVEAHYAKLIPEWEAQHKALVWQKEM
jgi:long-chain acyl-CoA synthetase